MLYVCLYSIFIYYASDPKHFDDLDSCFNAFDEDSGRNYEFKSIDTDKHSSVRGRLKCALHEWKLIDAPQFIIDVIELGYKLPFMFIPIPKVFKNNRSALKESAFVNEAIQSLLKLNCIKELSVPPEIVNPLSVSIQRSGKKRLILDLRHINLHLFKNKFKCEDIAVAKEVIKPGDFLFTFDLKSGYHHVDIFPDHTKYLSFSWIFPDGSTKYYSFLVLPFGLSTAPYLFTKLLKPLVKKWRSEGKPIVVFLDDGLGAGTTLNSAKITSLQVHSDLLKFGLLPNEDKCVWNPQQIITWLGSVFNMKNSTISATDKRIQSLKSDIENIMLKPYDLFHVKRIASTVGKIISFSSCIGNVTRLMSRNLYTVINSSTSWNGFVRLNKQAINELEFWKNNVSKLNGIPLWPSKQKPSRIVYSDASNVACGSFITIQNKVFQQNWSDKEKSYSSTYRELLSVFLSLESFAEDLVSQTVVLFTDNQNVVSIIEKGSKKSYLQEIALKILNRCALNAITLEPQWIPRYLNHDADQISRIVDHDDYTINDDVFNYIDEVWGPHTIDRFACHYNKKTTRFNSKYFQPGTNGVNAFTQDWAYELNWLCPPVYLTVKVINHLKLCKARGTLIVPLWKSAHYWTSLCTDGTHWNNFIQDWMILPHISNLFTRGKAKNSIFGNGQLKFIVVALRIDFSVQYRKDNAGFCTALDNRCKICN